jgi:FkbM family methyltransferase
MDLRLLPVREVTSPMPLLSLLQFITNHPVNRNRKLDSLVRFAKWQISSRLAPGAIVFEWINGSRFLVRNGDTGLTGNIYTGLHEFDDMGYLLHVLRPDDLFIDIGANLGSYTILACAAIGARGYAFEPVPSTFARLVDNIRLNNIEDRVAALNLGLAHEEGIAKFTTDLDTVNHVASVNGEQANTIAIKVTTLDLALGDVSPGLIKIDVEGYETQVLQGAVRTLCNDNLHSVIMELNGSGERYGFAESRILSKMLNIGFKTFSYDPLSRSLTNLKGKNLEAGNTLFIRNESLVQERLRSAPEIKVLGIVI